MTPNQLNTLETTNDTLPIFTGKRGNCISCGGSFLSREKVYGLDNKTYCEVCFNEQLAK